MPNPMTLRDRFDRFAQLVKSDHGLQAIDEFYHDNIHQYENYNEPLVGKKLLSAKEETISQTMSSVTVSIDDVVISQEEGKVWGRQVFIFESAELGKKILDQAFMQQWEDGLIIEQRFYYAAVRDYEMP